MISINNERDLRSIFILEINKNHSKNLHDINFSSYRDLLIKYLNEIINKIDSHDIFNNNRLKYMFGILVRTGVLQEKSDKYHSWYKVGEKLKELSDDKILELINYICNEENTFLEKKNKE